MGLPHQQHHHLTAQDEQHNENNGGSNPLPTMQRGTASLFSAPHYPTSSFKHTPYPLTNTLPPHQEISSLNESLLHSLNDISLPQQLSTTGRSNFQVYKQLQFPSSSNNGSMKKKKKNATAENDRPPGIPPSPSSSSLQAVSSSLPHLEREQLYSDEADVKIWTVQYVPEMYNIKKKIVKV